MAKMVTCMTGVYPAYTTAELTATLTDAGGEMALPQADSVLSTLVLTLSEAVSGEIINNRRAQSILNANGGTIGSDAILRLRLDPADMALLFDGNTEKHFALLEWTWGSPSKTGRHKIEFSVSRL